MSGNNFTPDADLPMAWALNDTGIPIAVAVDPTQQNRYTDAYTVPYAIPVAQPINNLEIPIAVPIATPVDATIQSVQINELERANIQMAERVQSQERALKEEKIKQEKQQQELQKAQQQLKDAKRNQEIENQFNLTQMRLISEYTNRINLAAEYRQIGNFDKAIQQYEMSINSIEQLRSAFYNKENSKRHRIFTPVPESYSNYIFQSRLEIANCFIAKGELVQALDALHDLMYSGDSYVLDAKIKECRDLIYKQAQKLISDVGNIPTRGNAQHIATAQNLLTDAEKLLTKIGQTNDSNFVMQKMRVEWDSMRDRINRDCRDLLTTTFELTNYEAAAQRARTVVVAYANYASLLDSHEIAYQTDIVNMLPSFEQVAAQLRINALTKEVDKCLSIGDIPAAYLKMNEIYNLAVQIKNPHYVEQKGLVYHHPQSYYMQLQRLELEMQQFNLRSKQQHNQIVDKIIAAILNKLAEDTPNASLFEKDLKVLCDKLNSIIQEQWYKFDRRSAPRDLINNIAEQIAADCSPIGMFKKWYYWSYATSCLNDTSKTLATVSLQISDYVPITEPDCVVNMNNAMVLRQIL